MVANRHRGRRRTCWRSSREGADLTVAMQDVCRRLRGAFTLVAVDAQDPDRVVAARRELARSVVGVGEGGELPRLRRRGVHRAHPATPWSSSRTRSSHHPGRVPGLRLRRQRRPRAAATRSTGTSAAEKDGYDWFMRKEIFEQPRRSRRLAPGCPTAPTASCSSTRCACPTSDLRRRQDHHHRGGHVLLRRHRREVRHRELARIPVEVELASEFRLPRDPTDPSTSWVAISQSGETADTLQAIRHAREQRSKVLSICNTNGSTIPRESDGVIYPTPARRSASRRRRDSSPSSSPATSSRSTSPR